MRLSVAVTGHISRWQRYAMPLLHKLTSEAARLGVRVDGYMDRHSYGPWYNFERALLGTAPDDTHRVVLQDDVVICQDFIATLAELIPIKPDAVLYPFSSSKDQISALREGAHWYRYQQSHGAALVIPKEIAWWLPEWAADGSRLKPDSWGVHPKTKRKYLHDDYVLRQYCEAKAIERWATVPSLVQHVGQESSLLGHSWSDWRERGICTARVFIGENVSGLGIDWSV